MDSFWDGFIDRSHTHVIREPRAFSIWKLLHEFEKKVRERVKIGDDVWTCFEGKQSLGNCWNGVHWHMMVLADVIESHEQELRARSCVWPSTCGLLLPFCLSNLLVARPTSLSAPTEMPQTIFPNPILTPRSHHHPSLPRQNSSVREQLRFLKGK